MAYTINPRRCPQNHRCPAIRSCPTGAISQAGYAAPVIDKAKCIDCGACARVCPTGAMGR
jgi:Fe-S-cluster-containing hydrogenase component 2